MVYYAVVTIGGCCTARSNILMGNKEVCEDFTHTLSFNIFVICQICKLTTLPHYVNGKHNLVAHLFAAVIVIFRTWFFKSKPNLLHLLEKANVLIKINIQGGSKEKLTQNDI